MASIKLNCILSLLLVSIICLANGKVFPKNQLSIAENAGFLSYLTHPVGFAKLLNCTVVLEGSQSLDLDPTVDSAKVHNVNGALIQRYSKSVCGVRVKQVKKSLAGTWSLLATDDRLTYDKDSFKIEVLQHSKDKSKNLTVSSENPSVKFQCPNSYGARHCRIWNPDGVLFEDKCEDSTSVTADYSTWKCRTMHWGEMSETLSEVNVVLEQKSANKKATIVEDSERLVLSCQESGSSCRAHQPNGDQFWITEGLLTERYSAYDTSLSSTVENSICSLEIEKPLKKEDFGVWRMYLDEKNTKGCVFQVGPKVPAPESNVNNPILLEIFKPPNSALSSFEIECKVPYEITYCYLQGPEISSDKPEQPMSFYSTKFLGICKFTIKQMVPGLYVCGVNSINGGEDVQTYYNVKIFQSPAKTELENFEGKKGQPANLLVKTRFGHPITYCRFTTPNGEVHGVSDKFNMEGNYRFYGAGLVKGECGLTILKVDGSHFGIWKSTFKVESAEYTIDIVMTQNSYKMAFVEGPILAFATIAFFIVGYLVYKKRNERRRSKRYDRGVGTELDYSSASHDS